MDFEAEWDRCSAWIEAALAYDPTHNLDDVREAVLTDRARFWPGHACAIVTEVSTWPRMKTGHIWLAGGDMIEMQHVFQPQIEAHFRAEGCALSIITGRRGWSRIADYRPTAFSCVKELA